MNPLTSMLLYMLKVANYYETCSPTAAEPIKQCLAFYMNSSIPMISSVVRDMRDKGLIDRKTGRITPKGIAYLSKPLSKMNDGQLGVMLQDVFEEVITRVNSGVSPHEFVVSGSDCSYMIDEFCQKWSENEVPFLDTNMYFEDEQVDHLHQEVESFQLQS